MSLPAANMTTGGWRAEDAVRSIFGFKAEETLQPGRLKCLSWVKAGDRRCAFFEEMQKKDARCSERDQLVNSFRARKTPENPMNFKDDVMRFIELACCHKFHVLKMEIAAKEWFKKHGSDVPRKVVSRDQDLIPAEKSPLHNKSPESRHCPTTPSKSIEMTQYIRGRDPEQLRMAIEEPFDNDDGKPGQLYIWISPDVPGYVKIGYTGGTLESRFEYARKDCSIKINPKYTTGVLPHAKRLETIVHNELAEKRYRFADPCTFCLVQRKRHQEWFLCTFEYAKGVAEYWKAWLLKGMYDAKLGCLTTTLRDEVRSSASPVSIKSREQRLSLEPESSKPADVSSNLKTPPSSPSPTVKDTQPIVETRTLRSASSKTKEVKAEAVEVSHMQVPSSKATENKSEDAAAPSTPPEETVVPTIESSDTSLPVTPTVHRTRKISARTSESSSTVLPIGIVTPPPETEIDKGGTGKESKADDALNPAPVSKGGLKVRNMVSLFEPTKKDPTESASSAEAKVQILGTKYELRATAVRKKQAGV